jgi:hypothetical protein
VYGTSSKQRMAAREREAVVNGILSNEADNFPTSSNAILRFEAIKYLTRSEIFLLAYTYRKVQLEEGNQNTVNEISITTRKQ